MNHQEEIIMCEKCNIWLEKVKTLKHLSSKDLFILKNPRRVIAVNYPVRMDNGSVRLVSAFRIQYNDALGPTKGGIRIHPSINQEKVGELAFLMTLKTALMELPYGGAKGGIKLNPEGLSVGELERVCRGYVKEMYRFIGPKNDIPAPDVNTDARVMAWMMDEYEQLVGSQSPGVITGKPLVLGGSLGRDTATARGAFFLIEKHFGNKKVKPTVAIQGFGNAGSFLASYLFKAGFKVVAISDERGGLYRKEGLNIEEALKQKASNTFVPDLLIKSKPISNEDLLRLDVDMLVPAALGGVITKENAQYIRAKTIVEVANAPILSDAEDILEKKKISIIPDILANSGGVIVSYFEWVQNLQGYAWTKEDVDTRLQDKMLSIYDRVLRTGQENKLSFRTASYVLAIQRILEAEQLRGRL